MYDFDFVKPATLAQALAALGEDEAQALGGGQTLIPALKQRLASPSVLVSLSGIREMQGICRGAQGEVCIGGATTHAQVADCEDYPALAALAGQIGDPAVRARGTIGGSLANNDPSACYPAAALASAARIKTDRREIEADDFFEGLFTTALEEGEIITEVRFPVPQAAHYEKFVQPASRFAMVGVFLARTGADVRIAITGAAEDGVFRWHAAEEALSAEFSLEALEGLGVDAQDMMEDLHASKEYRAHLVAVMTKRAVKALAT